MKKIGLILISLLVSCSQLMRGQEQPVIMKKENVYYTTCSGAVESMGNCYQKATRTCSKGYKIFEKSENANGGLRSITFKCE